MLSPKSTSPPVDLNLNSAFAELEQITKEFEQGEVDLEAGIPKFKRGLELAHYLKNRLSEMENEIIEVKKQFSSNDDIHSNNEVSTASLPPEIPAD